MDDLKTIIKRMKYKIDSLIFIFDIDGTIVNNKNIIDNDTIQAIEHLRRLGAKIGIATGRPLCTSMKIMTLIQTNFPSIILDGQVVLDENHNIIYRTELNISNIEYVYKNLIDDYYVFIEDVNFIYCFSIEEQLIYAMAYYWKRKNIKLVESVENLTPLRIHLKNKLETLHGKKLSLIKNKFIIDSEISSLSSGWITIRPKNIDKSVAMDKILEKYNYSYDQIIFFGNEKNDLALLKKSAIGIAMKNSDAEILPFAKYVTSDIDGKGVCDAINIILETLR